MWEVINYEGKFEMLVEYKTKTVRLGKDNHFNDLIFLKIKTITDIATDEEILAGDISKETYDMFLSYARSKLFLKINWKGCLLWLKAVTSKNIENYGLTLLNGKLQSKS